MRDTLSGGQLVQGPTRMNVGAGLGTDLFGFFPGVVGSTRRSGTASRRAQLLLRARGGADADPGARCSARRAGWRRTWSPLAQPDLGGKLRQARPRVRDTLGSDTPVADSAAGGLGLRCRRAGGGPQGDAPLHQHQPVQYDFSLAGASRERLPHHRISNTITSDYLKGLTLQMDARALRRQRAGPGATGEPGRLGRFAPRLTALSTGF